ncbi:hypothetical protein ACWERV_12105 [Streptomyces sp. NPDC004031]
MLPTTGDRVAAQRRPESAVPAAPDVLAVPAPRTPVRTRTVACPAPAAAEPAGRPQPVAGEGEGRAEDAVPAGPAVEPQGCLYALSQPPLMLFLLVVGGLLGTGAAYDLIFL